MIRVLRLAAVAMVLGLAPGRAEDAGKPADPPGVVQMSAEQQKTVGLHSVIAGRQEISEKLEVPGTVAFDQGHVAILRPLAQARVTRLLVQPGDSVRAGQVLAELYMPSLADAQANLAAAQASLREQQAGVSVARDALRRGVILAGDGSMARAEAERRRLVLVQAQAGAESGRARAAALGAEVARLAPGRTPGTAGLTSPITGVVASLSMTPGELIDTSGQAAVVADLSVVLVLAQVPEASVALLAVGDPASVMLGGVGGGSGRRWQGRVVALGAALDPQARTLPARIQLANPDGALRAGMFVSVALTSDRGRNDLVVPSAAVQMVADKRVAFTDLGDGRFQSHELTLGVERVDWVEVSHGLQAGDRVVTDGSFALKAMLQKAMLGGAG